MARQASARGPYHEGELEVQRRAGVTAMASKIGRGIHAEIQPGADDFLAERTFAVIASRDAAGRVWASLLAGPLGFLDARDAHTLAVRAAVAPNDPLRDALVYGAQVGLIAIDFATRRRYRVNGRIAAASDGGFVLDVAQAYGNCPKYIQQRELAATATPAAGTREVARRGTLGDAQRAWIAGADTFFVATAHPEQGADASQRGGDPGFVRVVDPTHLVWPDYSGNTMFQTLGNLTVNAACGLLFPDFVRGATLQVSGEARIVWDEEEVQRVPGAERLVAFRVATVIETEGVLPVGWSGPERSPHNPR